MPANGVESFRPKPGSPLPQFLIVRYRRRHHEDRHEMIAGTDEHRIVSTVAACDPAGAPLQVRMTNAQCPDQRILIREAGMIEQNVCDS